MNLTKAAIYHSTLLSTVSPTYARELQTNEHGFGLDGVLRERASDLMGVLNGIDTHEWSPESDPHIAAHFSLGRLAGKADCKRALQKESGLAVRDDVPLFGLIGRLTMQKGVDVFAQILRGLLDLDLQILFLGTGDPDAARSSSHVSWLRPERFRAFLAFDNPP